MTSWGSSLSLLPIAHADDYYVDAVHGSDESGDGTEPNPWKKLQFAIDTIEGTAENPHTIHLAPGNYGPKDSGDLSDIYTDSYESLISEEWSRARIPVLYILSCNEVTITGISGVISCAYGSRDTVVNRCIMLNNSYSGIFTNCDILVKNTVFWNNENALWASGGLFTVIDCIFQNNLNIFYADGSAQLETSWCCFDTEYSGEGNIVGDPLLSAPENGDFRIGYGSPCIDTGDPDSEVPPGGGGRIDMGAWEYLSEPQLLPVDMITVEIAGDSDGIPELNEILDTRLTLKNTGEPAEGLTAVLSCSHPDVTILSGAVAYPDIGSWETGVPSGNGFRWQVTGASGWCEPAEFTVTWMASGVQGTIPVLINLHSDGPHVDPVSGNDETGDGSPTLPFKTISHALAAIRGGRWSSVTVYAHAGTYSPSSNGETFPIRPGDRESIEGDGRTLTHLDNDGAEEDMIIAGNDSAFRSMHIRTDCEERPVLIRSVFSSTVIEDCDLERVGDTPDHRRYAVAIDGSGTYLIRNCRIQGSALNTGEFKNDVTVENNEITGMYGLYSGDFINNFVEDLDRTHYSDINGKTIIRGNVLVSGGGRSDPGEYEFLDNIILKSSRGFGGEGNNRIVRNVNLDGGFSFHGSGFTTSHNISLSQRIRVGGFVGAGVYLDNSVAASLKPSLERFAFYVTYGGAFSLDHSIGVFGNTGVYWPGAAWSNHGIFYHNVWGDGGCHDAWYNDIRDCTHETNLDLAPEFVGSGLITALGPGYLQDTTAAWEPDRYAGYYVNPNVPNQDVQFYIIGNDATTLYVMGNPGVAAEVGDRFFFPDFHLRRISDGYAWDSPLIDAGNPDPMYNDPDGSRCDLGPYGGPLALTPMPVVPTWPPPDTPTATPTLTATPTPSMTPTATATATPVCDTTGVTLEMPLELYYPGDTCFVTVTVCNATEGALTGYPLFVVLDVYGSYFWGPGFTGDLDWYLDEYPVIPPGVTIVPVLDKFIWPVTGTSAAGIRFYAALTDPEVSDIFGDMDVFEFGWGE